MSKNKKKSSMFTTIAILLVVLIALIVASVCMGRKQPQGNDEVTTPTTQQNQSTTQATDPTEESTTEPTTEPTEPTVPPVVKESTATIGATGDILMHDLVIKSGYDSGTDSYDYNYSFEYFKNIVSRVDYAVANLEVTLCGSDNGYAYKGYPQFNSPDAIVDALKNAGFDLLLTANNHSYDTGSKGFYRTQEVVEAAGLPHIGSRPTQEAKPYYIAEVNGIKIGMINYTYNTSSTTTGKVALNGIPLSEECSALINTFSYSDLGGFYEKLEGEMEAMYQDGAEAIVLYIHWGNEYQTTENATQRKIAQKLCNMGIDVIVGNHAHVPQPVKLLTSEEDDSQKTLCLYSTGNALSNIYGNKSFPVNTEDGMLFTFTFAKYSDGTVLLESADVIPTWVYRYDENNVRKFKVLYMDDAVEDWTSVMDLSDSLLKKCEDSYDRTMGIVGAGLAEANQYYAANQIDVEASIGVE